MEKALSSQKIIFTLFLFSLSLSYAFPQTQHVALTLKEDNDFFTGTDRYFTNGTSLGLLFSRPVSGLTKRILPAIPSFRPVAYGVTLTQNIYTPSKLQPTEFLPHDRPYAGTLLLALSQYSISRNNRFGFYSEFSGGVVGHNAQGNDVQRIFHKIIHDELPQGWQNQVPNRVIANYQFDFSALVYQGNHVALINNAKVNGGNLQDDVALGGTLQFGFLRSAPALQSFFQHSRKLSAYVFVGAEQRYVIYNRLLATGFEDQEPPVTRWVNNVKYGFEMAGRWFKINYAVNLLSRERDDLRTHRYGSLNMTFRIY